MNLPIKYTKWLSVLTLFACFPLFGSPTLLKQSIKDDRICIRKQVDRQGKKHCSGFALPYKEHSLSEYLSDLTQSFTEQELHDASTYFSRSFEHISKAFRIQDLQATHETKTQLSGHSDYRTFF